MLLASLISRTPENIWKQNISCSLMKWLIQKTSRKSACYADADVTSLLEIAALQMVAKVERTRREQDKVGYQGHANFALASKWIEALVSNTLNVIDTCHVILGKVRYSAWGRKVIWTSFKQKYYENPKEGRATSRGNVRFIQQYQSDSYQG